MKPIAARVWLDELLAGLEPSSADLDRLVSECGKESQHHDYKAGALVLKADAADDIRHDVAGFANSDGGFLLIGYDEKHQVFDGCRAPGGSSLHDWVARILTQLSPYLTVQPRLRAVSHAGTSGEVLLISVERSAGLVPVVAKGKRLAFPLRIGDSTIDPPDFLMADLVLGRRNRPLLSVDLTSPHVWPPHDSFAAADVLIYRLSISLGVESRGLVFAEDVRMGVVCWSASTGKHAVHELPQSLRSYVDVETPPPWIPPHNFDPHWRLEHTVLAVHRPDSTMPARSIRLGPFERSSDMGSISIHVPVSRDVSSAAKVQTAGRSPEEIAQEEAAFRGDIELGAAIYVLAQNTPPRWFQLRVRYNKRVVDGAISGGKLALPPESFSLEPSPAERPSVYWRYHAQT